MTTTLSLTRPRFQGKITHPDLARVQGFLKDKIPVAPEAITQKDCFVMKESRIPLWRHVKQFFQDLRYGNLFGRYLVSSRNPQPGLAILLRKYPNKSVTDKAIEGYGWGICQLTPENATSVTIGGPGFNGLYFGVYGFRLSDTEYVNVCLQRKEPIPLPDLGKV